jgi:hypothetical protein
MRHVWSVQRPRWVKAGTWPNVAVGSALLFALSLAINLSHVSTTAFHADETRWINRAHYFTDLSDPFGPTWDDQYLTRGQPPLGSYLIGIGLLLQGRDTATNGVWDFAYGEEWNQASGAMPQDADLQAGRRTNALIAALTVVVVFFIGLSLAGIVSGATGGIVLLMHPLHIMTGSQALSDQLLILLIALSLLTAIHLGRRPDRGKALMLGILLGLGGATKLSPLLLTAPIALYGVALLLLARTGLVDRSRAGRLAPLLIVQPIISGITFLVSYPSLWPAPVERTLNLFKLRAQEMDAQASAWPSVAIDHPGIAMMRVYDRLTWEFSATGNLAETGLALFNIDSEVWGIDLLLASIGLAALVMLVIRHGLTSGTAIAAFILAGQTGTIVGGMQVDFYRYHLPVVLAVSILAGLGVKLIWDTIATGSVSIRADGRFATAPVGQSIRTGSGSH